MQRARDGNATRASAEIDDPQHARWIDPRSKTPGDQLGERRARHDHSLVDLEFESGEPHPAHQVGDGYTAAEPLGEQAEYLFDLRPAWLDRVRYPGIGMVEPERMEDERRSIIPRIGGAVPVGEPGGVELPRAKTCLLYTSPSPRDRTRSRMPSSA